VIIYQHVNPTDHKVKLSPASPYTTVRYCAQCSGEVVRTRAGKPVTK
jgi:hypothetical protein